LPSRPWQAAQLDRYSSAPGSTGACGCTCASATLAVHAKAAPARAVLIVKGLIFDFRMVREAIGEVRSRFV
jgi:hypothetical protein